MAAEEYGKYILVSRPQHIEQLQAWMPYASVGWLDGRQWEYHQLKDLNRIFDTEEQALAFGFAAARRWIDKER